MVNALTIVGAVAVVLVVGLFLLYVISLYNRIVRVQNRADNAWSDIDVLLKQRRDALTKLVDATAEVMEFEEDLLTALTEAREQVQRADSPKDQAIAGEQVKQAVSQFAMREEDYPELRSAENVQRLQNEIATLEEQIADRREVYNEAATAHNVLIQSFPYLLFARLLGSEQRELYDPPASETTDVDISQLYDDGESSTADSEGTPPASVDDSQE
jgi:LemA protein